jgi:hypothetical protein
MLRPQASALALRAASASQLLKPASTTPRCFGRRHRSRHYEPQAQASCLNLRRQHRESTAAGIGPANTATYMQRTTSGAAGNGLYTAIKYMCGAAGIGLGTTTKHLRSKTSGAAGNGLGTTVKYLRRTTSAAANIGLSTTINPPFSVAACVVNLEPHTGARPSVRLCVGPELARCVHDVVCLSSKTGLEFLRSAFSYEVASLSLSLYVKSRSSPGGNNEPSTVSNSFAGHTLLTPPYPTPRARALAARTLLAGALTESARPAVRRQL